MKLGQLLHSITEYTNDCLSSIEIAGVSANSSSVKPNYLFIAIPGYRVDGHDYIEDALNSGATVIVGEKEKKNLPVPYIQVANSRLALAKIACNFYENPSKKRTVIGITGTNGKTTTSFMLKHVLESAGITCSLFGSVFNIINGQASPSPQNTTLDSLELQKQISLSKDDVIIMEVSSHGLSQHRVDGIEFDFCLFTNLDHEHLDYHNNMEEYFSAKSTLFKMLKPQGVAIINGYDSWGERLSEILKTDGYNTVMLGNGMNYLSQIKVNPTPSALLFANQNKFELKLNMLGLHNVYNAAMAFLTAGKLGLEGHQIRRALESFSGVPGRFEMFQHPSGGNFVIDYAHTADAFYHCLKTAKEMEARRIIHIYGFRGNRDQEKRHNMARISQELSDLSILTFDDLNDVSTEEMTETLHHYNFHGGGLVIPDRTLAIKHAWDHANDGDWIFITGKGNETYQQQFELPASNDMETLQYLLH